MSGGGLTHSASFSSLRATDLNSFCRITKSFPIQVTCKGNDAAGVYQHALASHFGHNAITWKKLGKAFFPYPITFPLKFVPFEDKLVLGGQGSETLKNVAFLHMFFINAASVDEYRTSVRHNVSEWFAVVSLRSDVQWLIVIDSTRAKEKKNRTVLIDRLRQDFSKHVTRLVEVSESVEHGSFSSLVTAVQSSLLAHLDILAESWEANIHEWRHKTTESGWDMARCVNGELDYARLYWSLGALDYAAKLYDELDFYVIHTIVTAANAPPPPPNWLTRMTSVEMATCPSITHLMAQDRVEGKSASVLAIRHCLLAHKLLCCLHVYQSRLRASSASPSIRVDFASVLLRHAYATLDSVRDLMALTRSRISPLHLSVWIVQLVGEALFVSGLLAETSTVDSAAEAVCALHTARFDGLLTLSPLVDRPPDDAEKKAFVQWLETCAEERNGGDAALFSTISEAVTSATTMHAQLQRTHDTASTALTQSGRCRQAARVGYEFARFLSASGRDSSALPYVLRFVSSLMSDGVPSLVTILAVRDVIKRLDENEDYERLINLLLYLMQYDSDESERRKAAENLLDLLKKGREMRMESIRMTTMPKAIKCPFDVQIDGRRPVLEPIIPGSPLSVPVSIRSSFLSPIPNCRVKVTLVELNGETLGRNPNPSFKTEYSARDGATRLLCVHRGEAGPITVEPSLSLKEETVVENPQRMTLSLTGEQKTSIGYGETRVHVEGSTERDGCYMVEAVEISLVDESLIVELPLTHIRSKDQPLLFWIQSRKHSLSVQGESANLLSGVAQTVQVTLVAGSKSLDRSKLVVKNEEAEEEIEFLSPDGLWESLVELEVEPMLKDEQRAIELSLYLPLTNANNTNVRTRKVRFSWIGEEFVVELNFVPVFGASWTASYLEDKPLVELELTHPLAPEWTILPEEATLQIISSGGPPYKMGKLLSTEMVPIVYNGVTAYVWILPVERLSEAQKKADNDIRFRIQINFRAIRANTEPRRGFDRSYDFILHGDANIPEVEYEICTQVLSQQPGAQLCRVGAACHLVVSLRSLSNTIETLLVTISTTDDTFWKIEERTKTLVLRESGLGQCTFIIVPVTAGFLPYPNVALLPAPSSLRSEDRFWSEPSEFTSGKKIVSFERTAGRQIRVLGASQYDGRGSERDKKGTIRAKLNKLFE